MIWHPLLLAVAALDLLALGFAVYAASSYTRVLLGWEPGSPDLRQVALEGATDGASVAMRFSIASFVVSGLLLIVGISWVLPGLVRGAMCGTGVITAMGGLGQRALTLRLVALLALWIWRTLDTLNRRVPRPPAIPAVARWQLLSLPLLALAMLYTLRAMLRLDPHQPVNCCQAVYDTFRTTREATTLAGVHDDVWLLATVLGGVALGALAALGFWRRIAESWRARIPLSVFVVALLWLPVASLTLVRVLAAYHYQVLHHHCPWCLFSLDHLAVGYALYGALLLVALESIAALTACNLARREGTLAAVGSARVRRALFSVLLALLLFAVLTAGPALSWRLIHGVWMHGA